MGAVESTSTSWRYIEATAHRSKKLVLQQLQKSWAYYRMMQSGRIVNVYNVYEQPLYVTPPTAGKWIDRDDSLPDAVSSEPAALAYWKTKYLAVPIAFNELEMWQKEGDPTQLWNMADVRAAEAAWAKGRLMSSAFFNGVGGKQPTGISYVLEKAVPGSQTATVGGLAKATYPWWRTKYVQLTTNFGSIPASSVLPAGLLAALSLKDQCTIGTQIPTDLFTTKAIFDLFKRAMLEISSPYHLIAEEVAVAKFGFQNLKFDGMSLGWDPNCVADSIYCVSIGQNFDPSRTGDPRDTAKMDRDFEEARGASNFIETDGGIWMAVHPNIRGRRLAPRSPYRQLSVAEWIVDSFELLYGRPSDMGVAGSDNGSRWSTWS